MSIEVGTEVSFKFKVEQIDGSDDTCYLKGELGEDLGWVTFDIVNKAIEESDPDLKRKRIEADIAKLQEQLANIK